MERKKIAPEDQWQKIEYWTKRHPDLTTEECQKLLDEKLLIQRQKKPACIEYWEKNYPDKTHEEHLIMKSNYNKSCSYQNIEYWERHYPDKTPEERMKMMKERIESSVKKRPDNTEVNNPAHRSKTTEKQRKERSVTCIEYWEKHYPDNTPEERLKMMQEKLAEMKEKSKNTPQQTQLRYWLLKGYNEEEAKKKLSERQRTFSLEKCIKKYGEEEGRKRFEERQTKWKKSLFKSFEKYGDGRSQQSDFAYDIITMLCEYLNINIPIREKYISDDDGAHYAFDFTLGKKMIEFNGDYWHCNPELYDADFYNKRKQMTAKEIWEYDKKKTQAAEKKGYTVLTIWESEYNENRKAAIEKCIKYLNV